MEGGAPLQGWGRALALLSSAPPLLPHSPPLCPAAAAAAAEACTRCCAAAAARRVLINKLGDMVVRPSYVESTIRKLPTGRRAGWTAAVRARRACESLAGVAGAIADGICSVMRLASQQALASLLCLCVHSLGTLAHPLTPPPCVALCLLRRGVH